MEGLGAAVKLTTKIVSLCAEYSSAVKNASHDIQRLRERIESLDATLKGVLELLQGPHGPRLRTSQKLRDALNNSRSLLDSIAATLERKFNGGRMQRTMRVCGFRALKWPFESKEMENSIAALEQYQHTMAVAIQIDQTAEVLTINHKIDLSKLPVAKGAAFDSQANEYVPRCHPRTRINVLAGIYDWFEDPHGKCIYWLCGMAGTGKSTISRTVAEYLTEKKIPCASFFFKKGEGDRGKADLFFTTIATQLVQQMPGIVPHVRAAIEADMNISDKAKNEQFERLILEPLNKCKDQQSAIVSVVIDALDECDLEEDARSIVHLLARAMEVTSIRLRFFVTSRPELPIRLGFKGIGNSYKELALHEIPKPDIRNDIAIYLEDELKNIVEDYNMLVETRRQLPSEWPGNKNTEKLVDMAIPLFIYAATACRFIRDRRLGGPEEKLEIFFNSHRNPKSNIDATYLPILQQLTRDLKGGEKRAVITRFKEIVGTIVLLASPLSTTSLANLLAVDTEKIDNHLDMLHSVLNIPLNPDEPIRLFHLSFRDFLIDKENCDINSFWVDEQETHAMVMVRCLKLLSTKTLRKDICDLRRPGKLRVEIEQQRIDGRLPPETQYACLYWVYHLKESRRTVHDHDHVYDFLTRHLLHWIEALSLIGRISESVDMLDSLLGMVDSEDGVEISAIIRNMKRILLVSRLSIDEAPLQIYSSAILFAPEQSKFRSIFRDQFPSWISPLPQVDNDWDACLATLEGYGDGAKAIGFSPDGQHLATTAGEDRVKILDATTGRCTATFVNKIWTDLICFSPDNRQLASNSGNAITLWNLMTGCCIMTLDGHKESVTDIRFAPDGRQLASASRDNTVKLWDTATGDCIRTFEDYYRYKHPVQLVSFAPDGRQLASASSNELRLQNGPPDDYIITSSYDKTIKLWDTATGRCMATLVNESPVNAVSFSPDGRQLASASYDKTIKLWDAAIGSCTTTLTGHNDVINTITFRPDGQRLASASSDNTIKLWDTATGLCITTFKGHRQTVRTVTFRPDGRHLASTSVDGTVKLWDTATSHNLSATDGHSKKITAISFTPDGRWLASASEDCTVKLWNTETGRCIVTFKGHNRSVTAVSFTPDGHQLASASKYDKTVKLWDVTTGHCLTTLQHDDKIISVTFAPNSRQLASISSNDDITTSRPNIIKIWDIKTGRCTATLENNDDFIPPVVFSPNSQQLISNAAYKTTTKIWNSSTGSCTATLPDDSWVSAVAFSPNGELLALSSTHDCKVNIWDMATYDCIMTLSGHSATISAISFAPNGKLVSASDDNTLKLWDIATGRCTETLKGYDTRVSAINFAQDGKISCDLIGTTLNIPSMTQRWPLSSHLPTPKLPVQGPSSASPIITRRDIGINNQTWVTWDSHRILWLPPAYRPSMSAVRASTLAIGCDSGRVFFIRFSDIDELFS
ncbi:vegetative incompatibility protein HET-E-1 [Trichoderma sp. SZMC 28012]